MGNKGILDNKLLQAAIEQLSAKLPAGWQLTTTASPTQEQRSMDAVLRIRAPDSNTASILVELKRQLEPKDLDYLTAGLPSVRNAPILVIAPFLSARTQERLRTLGFQYADVTGNIRLSLSKPGLYVESHGAEKNPEPAARDRRSLKGAKAGRLIRALCDFRPPLGLRELAKRAGVDAGYASRIIGYLDRQVLLVRQPRGPITSSDWAGLLRRWSQEYSPFQGGRIQWFLAARGLPRVADGLRTATERYAVSGSWAANQFAPAAPPRLFLCYAEHISELARVLDLKPAEAGSNVAMATPFDSVVYARTSVKSGIKVVTPSQVVVDLLTSPGRGPNEAEALMEWMRENEHAWRA